MKYKILIITFFAGILFASCSDTFLDNRNPNEMDTSNFWKTSDDLQKGIDAAYRPLRFNGCYGRWLHILYVQRSDEGYSTSPNAYFQAYSNFLVKSYNDDGAEAIFFTWLDTYKGIFWTNQVIDNSKNISMDEDLKKRIQGEAYFIRGLHYFNIAEVFGRGPLKLSSYPDAAKPAIAEQPQILEQALKDFDQAILLLPLAYTDAKDLGRVTQGAARGMRVKVLMQQHNWEAAATECSKLFALKNTGGQPLYSLVPNYKDNFTQANENNSESIFEVQYAAGFQNSINVGYDRAKFMGISADGLAWADAFPRMSLYNEFKLENTTSGQPDPRLKSTLAYYDAANSTEQFYGKTWDQLALNHNMIYWKKYSNYDTQTIEDYNSGINFRVVRLADLYLLCAEALNELGRTSEAYTYINKVRSRAGLPNLENSTAFTGIGNDHDKMKTQIMHERTCELAGESTRWFDLERWGLFDTADGISWLKSRDTEFNNFVVGVNNRFPIPYREVSLVPLAQNPGY
jgi:starch-binding outer membrane protein, SusD/RagB family